MNIFPMMQPQTLAVRQLPLCREVAWDFKEDKPLFQGGEPVLVERERAVLTWAWKALHTQRYLHPMYTWNYGNQLGDLVGQHYTEELKQAEARRYVEECLLQNPYIKAVGDISVAFAEDRLRVGCTIETIYGKVKLGGENNAG